MPWQEFVADVGGEIDPVTGRPAYREIVCTVPRQSGKTTLLLSFELERALLRPTPQRIAYSAQTGLDARRKLLEDQVPAIERSPLGKFITRQGRAQGSESIVFRSGSRIDLQATSKDSGHGRTVDLGVIDEAFADTDDRREQAILPAMATRADGQLLVFSTAGDQSSTYLRRKVDAGRSAALAGSTTGIAYFEWSAEELADPDDPDVWWSCMPALAGGTIAVETIRHARQTMSDGEFRRAYLNQWTLAGERVIPLDVWERIASDVAPEPKVFAVDINPERTWTSIAVADAGSVELVEHRPGVAWVHNRLVELWEKWQAPIVVDVSGPAGTLIEDLKRSRVTVQVYQPRQYTYACQTFFDRCMAESVSIRPNRELDVAAAGATRRTVGDGWAWARRNDQTDISPLVAATLAVDAATKPGARSWVM